MEDNNSNKTDAKEESKMTKSYTKQNVIVAGIIGCLVGAIIATSGFLVYNKTHDRRPDFKNGERMEFNGERPDFDGEMPDFENGEMPNFENGEKPSFKNKDGKSAEKNQTTESIESNTTESM